MKALPGPARSIRLGVLLAACLAAAMPADADSLVWRIPGVVRSPGLNGTNFVSDLVITNPGETSAQVSFIYAPALSPLESSYQVGSGGSLIFRDVVNSIFGVVQAVGGLTVISDVPVILRARTYNTAPTGTFGVALPVIPDDRLLASGQSADSLWLDQDAASDRGYRTNIAVLFPDASGGRATVSLFDAQGSPAGQREFALDAPGFQQLSVGSFATKPLPVGRARVDVTRGRAAAYSAVVDNVTGDGSLYLFEDLPVGAQDTVVSGVSRADGRLGTFWRTDARFYNPSDSDAVLTVAFHAAGPSNPSPPARDITVPAGRILDVPDVLNAVLGLPVGSSGALRLRSASPVAVLCRTSNLDPTGARPGSFGAQQKPVPLLSYRTSADGGVMVAGIKQGTAYRTNVGFAAGPDGADFSLTLKNPSGGTIATAAGSLGPFGWTQPGVGTLFGGASIPDGSYVLVNVIAGSLDVFDSSIDNGSGDSVVTGADPLPIEIPSSATIGPAGGSVRSEDGRLTLRFPAGSISSPTNVGIQTSSTSLPAGVGSGYVLSVDVASFARPPIATLRIRPGDLAGTSPEWLALAYQSGGSLYELEGASWDSSARTLSAPLAGLQPSQASSRQPLASHNLELFPITNLKITPRDAGVVAGRVVRFEVTGLKHELPNKKGPLVSVDFREQNSDWKLVSPGAPDGLLLGEAAQAIYTAPQTVTCVEKKVVVFRYDNGGGITYELRAPIQVVPRLWTLTAKVIVDADFCLGEKTGDPKFTLETDMVSFDTALRDDLTFEPGSSNVFEKPGSLKSTSWCPPKDCSCDWEIQPSTVQMFVLGRGDFYYGTFYFQDWNFLLGNLIGSGGSTVFEWNEACPSGTLSHAMVLPSIGGTPETMQGDLWFTPGDSCTFTSSFYFWEFTKLFAKQGLYAYDPAYPYNKTLYFLMLTPRG